MVTTILFDLDGTLLPLDLDIFIENYFKHLSIKLKDHFEPKLLTKLVWDSTRSMIESNDNLKTNEEVFFENFYKHTDIESNVLNPIFDEFYTKDFNELKKISDRSDIMIDAIEILKEKGYNLVVATNPIFPEKAIIHRINWAGLNYKDFKFITTFEKMHYCKPNLNYYKEILENINTSPNECIMVGNDVEEDMVAKKLGLETYLIEDHIIQRSGDLSNVDHKGNYEDFLNFAKHLPNRS
ncbi:HAD family hydrolase [Serpentinicella sp. ANB-PHB4]|uniref:HAD family hydrolase n=1 Tax=Serpentinicella sp. ANB-PHB4 TaxID=3074076 RepID=UPI002867879B|nr:HAD family hydrolase [Serpentinicella sp. ANB-PHB4]MDR5659032.1 HAD family hydrolase [Serpentinicella sp. ANB-PHB4]